MWPALRKGDGAHDARDILNAARARGRTGPTRTPHQIQQQTYIRHPNNAAQANRWPFIVNRHCLCLKYEVGSHVTASFYLSIERPDDQREKGNSRPIIVCVDNMHSTRYVLMLMVWLNGWLWGAVRHNIGTQIEYVFGGG